MPRFFPYLKGKKSSVVLPESILQYEVRKPLSMNEKEEEV
jgi:hypothetical protein